MAERNLKATMPVEGADKDKRYGAAGRRDFSHLEAIARLLVGLAPWLELAGLSGDEESLRSEYASLARSAIDAATDPVSPDYVNWSFSFQPIVDAAFLVNAILRAPTELWGNLEARVRGNVIAALKATRSRKPHFNNWLLFSAMIETGLKFMGAPDWDHMRVDYALRQHEQWYKGDGVYGACTRLGVVGRPHATIRSTRTFLTPTLVTPFHPSSFPSAGDGPDLHADYYNSLVIQPMLVDIIETVGETYPEWGALKPGIMKRAVRYGEILERTISETGTFPPLGRSLAYRCGAMQHLAQMALQDRLGADVTPEQVRCALGAVIRRSLEAPGTYDADGWLRIGFAGSQPEVGEMYISTGSLYLASTAFLPLGLPPSHPFWSAPPRDWSQKRIWAGGFAPIDHALDHEVI